MPEGQVLTLHCPLFLLLMVWGFLFYLERKVSVLHLENHEYAVLIPWLETHRIVFLGRSGHIQEVPTVCQAGRIQERVFGSPLLRSSGPRERKWSLQVLQAL